MEIMPPYCLTSYTNYAKVCVFGVELDEKYREAIWLVAAVVRPQHHNRIKVADQLGVYAFAFSRN